MSLKPIDWADEEAQRLFDLIRNGESDAKVIYEIGKALRDAHLKGAQDYINRAGVCLPFGTGCFNPNCNNCWEDVPGELDSKTRKKPNS